MPRDDAALDKPTPEAPGAEGAPRPTRAEIEAVLEELRQAYAGGKQQGVVEVLLPQKYYIPAPPPAFAPLWTEKLRWLRQIIEAMFSPEERRRLVMLPYNFLVSEPGPGSQPAPAPPAPTADDLLAAYREGLD